MGFGVLLEMEDEEEGNRREIRHPSLVSENLGGAKAATQGRSEFKEEGQETVKGAEQFYWVMEKGTGG